MSDERMPAVSLIAVPGRVKQTIELATEIERRGYAGIYVPSLADAFGFCEALALTTERIRFGTSIVNIYTRHPRDWAQSAALLHELSEGRFVFGVGVSHDAMNAYLGVRTGKPLHDMRKFVADLRAGAGKAELPPVVLAALRDPMVKLAGEIGDGLVFANGARSFMAHSRGVLPADRAGNASFFFGNMIPTCISDDVDAAAARNRKTMVFYLTLPNYREYWKKAGYGEEMAAVERALENGEKERLTELMTDRWLADCTLFGNATRVREQLEAWYDAGVTTPILVPSSAAGNQMKAFEELFATFG
jgi:alkanesulfonate monooxygenase SsuD/methylene tetrahydromethanopterin reductase-like flavin-dependent oxidoreductase (luciferase family)